MKRRDKYTCQKCGATERIRVIESAHIYGRWKKSVRWSLIDGVCLCWNCHRIWAEVMKAEFLVWSLNRLTSEERDYLIRESEVIVMVNQSYIEERKAILRAEEENLQEPPSERLKLESLARARK